MRIMNSYLEMASAAGQTGKGAGRNYTTVSDSPVPTHRRILNLVSFRLVLVFDL